MNNVDELKYDVKNIKEWLNEKLQISTQLPEITYKPLSNKSEIKKTIRNTNRCFKNPISVWLFNMWFNAAFMLFLVVIYLIITFYGNPLLWVNYLTLNNYHNIVDLSISPNSNCQSITFMQNRINLLKSKNMLLQDYNEEDEFTCYYSIRQSNPSSLLKLYNNGTRKYIGTRGTMAISNKVLNLIKFYVDKKNLNALNLEKSSVEKNLLEINGDIKDYSYHIKSPNDACTDDPYCYNGIQEDCCRTNIGLIPREYWSEQNTEKLCDNPLLPCYSCERGLDAVPAGIVTATDKQTKLMLYICSGKEIYKSLDKDVNFDKIVYKDENFDIDTDNEDNDNDNDNRYDLLHKNIIPSQKQKLSISKNNINHNILKMMDYNTCMSGRGSLKFSQGKCICRIGWTGLNCNTQVGVCKSKKYTLPQPFVKNEQQQQQQENLASEEKQYYKTCDGVLKINGNLDNQVNVTGIVKNTCLFNDLNNPHIIISHKFNECLCQCCYCCGCCS